jgi:AcrR family transcriptional regulator
LHFAYRWYTDTYGMRMSRAEQQQRTRDDVLEAADRLFVEQGFHATSVDQIAEAAGYTKGAVYSNFAAKEDLFFAVYERRVARSVAELERTLARADSPRAWLESVADDTSARRGRDDRWMSTFFEFWAYVVRRPALRERFAAIHGRMHEPFVTALERHADEHRIELPIAPLQLHLAMSSMSLGLVLERLIAPDGLDADLNVRMARLVLDDLSRGADDGGSDQAAADRRRRAAPRARARRG